MPTRKNERIYIFAIDDEKDLLMLVKKSLVSRGFEVATSLHAENLWATIQTRPPDLIFLDIRMKGINGDEICTRLKQDPATAAIPVVLLSASYNIAEVAKTCGANGFVSKPYSTEKIISEIHRVFPGRTQKGAA